MEQYVYSLKNQVADEEKLGGKLDDEEKETINDGIESTIEWLDESGEVIYNPTLIQLSKIPQNRTILYGIVKKNSKISKIFIPRCKAGLVAGTE